MMTTKQTMMEPIIVKKSPRALRHEVKYTINAADAQILSSRLEKLFRRDLHADSHGVYRVSSLYFDTPYDKALRQKLDGVNSREKFRIRYYNADLSFIRLEKKIKQNGLCGKESARLSQEEVELLLNGDYRFLLQRQEPVLLEFYSKLQGQLLRPKTVVTYDREAYLYDPGNVRITIDRRVRTGMASLEFLDPSLPHTDVSEGLPVLEVKYDRFLPEVVQMAVQLPDRRANAYSKYAACRKYD